LVSVCAPCKNGNSLGASRVVPRKRCYALLIGILKLLLGNRLFNRKTEVQAGWRPDFRVAQTPRSAARMRARVQLGAHRPHCGQYYCELKPTASPMWIVRIRKTAAIAKSFSSSGPVNLTQAP